MLASAPRRLLGAAFAQRSPVPLDARAERRHADRLLASGKHVTMVSRSASHCPQSSSERLVGRLDDSAADDQRRDPVNDHTFRPVAMQAQVHATLDAALAGPNKRRDGQPRRRTARP